MVRRDTNDDIRGIRGAAGPGDERGKEALEEGKVRRESAGTGRGGEPSELFGAGGAEFRLQRGRTGAQKEPGNTTAQGGGSKENNKG